ncbi:hypothetical protein PIB30_060642, partial [Stylosanthes scabra]|nr:hypothetical protein [Stylosanthes scabra]
MDEFDYWSFGPSLGVRIRTGDRAPLTCAHPYLADPSRNKQTMNSSENYFFGTYNVEEFIVEVREDSDDDSKDDEDSLEDKRITELSRDDI